jgi:dihydrofolate reductase
MTTVAFIACSIDGFIAKTDGGIDWLTSIPNPTNSDYGYSTFFNTIDAVLMGKNTFLAIDSVNYWAYSKKVYVWSSTLTKLDNKYEGKAEIISGDFKSIIKKLEMIGIKRLYVDGGKTIQSFLKEDLLDEIILTTTSIILGNGISLFGLIGKEIKFELYKSEMIDSYIVTNYYKRRNLTIAST